MDMPLEEIMELLDAPTNAPAWPKNGFAPVQHSQEMEAKRRQANAQATDTSSTSKGPTTPSRLLTALRSACSAALAAEPQITQFDLQMGDGDCGEAVAGVCKSILGNLDSQREDNLPPLISFLESVGENVEDVGGSLGAILSILVTAFTNALHTSTQSSPESLNLDTVSDAALKALENLKYYTSAREGDRTVMDVLIPFIETLNKEQDFAKAVQVAKDKADATKDMKAKFGRATYVGDDGSERSRVPDPGAHAVAIWLSGLLEGFNKS
jgi:dihydroxyacetone kinase